MTRISPEQAPMFRFLAVMTAASMVGLQGYTILFSNYAVEAVGLDGRGVGIIQSIREVPGFLSILAGLPIRGAESSLPFRSKDFS